MGTPRLGAASVTISISDADGFRVVHGTDGTTLRHIPAEHLAPGDWDLLWAGITAVENKASWRQIEAQTK